MKWNDVKNENGNPVPFNAVREHPDMMSASEGSGGVMGKRT